MAVLASRGLGVRSWRCTFTISELAASLEFPVHMNNSEHETEGDPGNQARTGITVKRGGSTSSSMRIHGFQEDGNDGTITHFPLMGFELELDLTGFARRNAIMGAIKSPPIMLRQLRQSLIVSPPCLYISI